MPQINLIPWREQAKQANKARFAILCAGCVVLAFIVTMIIRSYNSSLISGQMKRNTFLQSELEIEQGQLTSLIAKKKELAVVTDGLDFIMSLRNDSYQAVVLLNELAKVTPEALSFNKVTRDGNNITIDGKTKSDAQVSLLMENIGKSKVFKQPDLSEISSDKKSTGDEKVFQLKVEQQDN